MCYISFNDLMYMSDRGQKATNNIHFCLLLGPLDTEMQKDILRLTGIRNNLFPCKESAAKLMKVLLDDEFTSGSHLDFFQL